MRGATFVPVPNRGMITLSIMMANIMQGVDNSILNVALPHVQGSLSASLDQIAWALTSYIVCAAIMMPLTEPVWFTTRPQPRALGSARACRRGQIPDMDRRQPASSGRLRGSAGGQGSGRRPAPRSEPTIVDEWPISLGDGAASQVGVYKEAMTHKMLGN